MCRLTLFPLGFAVSALTACARSQEMATNGAEPSGAVSAPRGQPASSEDVPHASPRGSFVVKLSPVRDENGAIHAIEFGSIIDSSLEADSGPFSIMAPVVYANVDGIADRVEELEVRDAAGVIPLTEEEDEPVPGEFPYFRHWRADRAVDLPVRIAYRSLVKPSGGPPGPALGIWPPAGGVSGAGAGFLVIPENVSSARSHVEWDLSTFVDNASTTTTFGKSAFELEGPPVALMQGWYVAGPLERYRETGHPDGFSVSWLGEFPFDENTEMAFAGEANAYLGDLSVSWIRRRVIAPLCGSWRRRLVAAALSSAALSCCPADRPSRKKSASQVRAALFHEMIHQWVGWNRCALRRQQLVQRGPCDVLYAYPAPARQLHIRQEVRRRHQRTREKLLFEPGARHDCAGDHKGWLCSERQQYQAHSCHRGVFYFADLDAKIRAAFGGRRTLAQFLRESFENREDDPPVTFNHDTWIDTVPSETGSEAEVQFETVILGGAVIIPAADACGGCFEQRKVAYTVDGDVLDGVEWVRNSLVTGDDRVKL